MGISLISACVVYNHQVLLPLMDGWQKTYHQACLYGSDELYLSNESKNGGYEDCLSMLDETLGHKSLHVDWIGDDQVSVRGFLSEKSLDAGWPCELGSCSESMFSCIHSEAECLDLIEGTRQGTVKRVRRRLNEKEKSMIRPGSIFIYKEEDSGIRRWTDKKEWTPSRVVGTFLAYRDLNGLLYKKTFSKQVSNERYHVVIYSSCEWERDGTCCGVFGKSRDGDFLRERMGPGTMHNLSEGHVGRTAAHTRSVLGFDGFQSQAVRPGGLHREFTSREHFWSE